MSNRKRLPTSGRSAATKSLKTTPHLHAKMKFLASLEAKSLTEFVSDELTAYLRKLGARAPLGSKKKIEPEVEMTHVELKTLHVNSAVHDKIKAIAAIENRTLTDLVSAVLEECWVRKAAKTHFYPL